VQLLRNQLARVQVQILATAQGKLRKTFVPKNRAVCGLFFRQISG
jgi:hypothetical protein